MSLEASTVKTFQMGADLTLRNIAEHHESLLAAMQTSNSVCIDFPDSYQADVSLLQLLESARILASTCGKSITLSKPASGNLRDILRRAGFLEQMTPEDRNFWLHNGE